MTVNGCEISLLGRTAVRYRTVEGDVDYVFTGDRRVARRLVRRLGGDFVAIAKSASGTIYRWER